MPYKDAAQAQAWRAANRKRINAKRRARHVANPEHKREADRLRYATNPEKFRANTRAYTAANPERKKARDRQRYAAKIAARPPRSLPRLTQIILRKNANHDERRFINETLFWQKVNTSGGPETCWLWTGSTDGHGYGDFNTGIDGKKNQHYKAHRLAYMLRIGPIPAELTLDHLCRTPLCVNPSHLEPVTLAENMRRGMGISARLSRRTHCNYGHPFAGDNVRIHRHGYRVCITCERAAPRRKKLRGTMTQAEMDRKIALQHAIVETLQALDRQPSVFGDAV